jgi:uncharacterized protein (TIGR00251 family)
MTALPLALRSHPEGTILPVRVTPKSSRTGILGVREGALRLAVAAPPEKGKANQAVIKLLAARLAIPRSRFILLAGETSRAKRILVSGVDPAWILSRLGPL